MCVCFCCYLFLFGAYVGCVFGRFGFWECGFCWVGFGWVFCWVDGFCFGVWMLVGYLGCFAWGCSGLVCLLWFVLFVFWLGFYISMGFVVWVRFWGLCCYWLVLGLVVFSGWVVFFGLLVLFDIVC